MASTSNEELDRLRRELDIEQRLRRSFEQDAKSAQAKAGTSEKKADRLWAGIKIVGALGLLAGLLVRTDRGKAAFDSARNDIAARVNAGEELATAQIAEIIAAAERNFGVSLSEDAKFKLIATRGLAP